MTKSKQWPLLALAEGDQPFSARASEKAAIMGGSAAVL